MQLVGLIFMLTVVTVFGQTDFEVLLELRQGFIEDPSGHVFESWDSSTVGSNGCPQNWYGISCNGGEVISISLTNLGLVGNFSFMALSSLRSLQNLSVSSNHLTGNFSSTGSIQSLRYLDLSSNSFHGFVPSIIVNMTNLVHVNLSYNNFDGEIPPGFSNLVALKYLDLSNNKLSGAVMDVFSQLGGAILVDFSNNSLSGSLDLGLGNSSFIASVEYLNVSRNLLSGQLFAHDGIPFFDSLKVFDASNNMLVGTIPPFQFVVSLQVLRLGGNQLSGSIPEALLVKSSMVLSELDLSLNQLEGPMRSVSSATLKKLNVSSNKLSGSLPVTVGNCVVVDLSNNSFSGNVSRIRSWGNFVEAIQLSSNLLSGAFPNETSRFVRLQSLKISHNLLNGHLPPLMDAYPELKVIDLSSNFLSGIVLPDFLNSTVLTDLNLSGNNLSGILSFHVAKDQNSSLLRLDLSHNSLTGHLPSQLRDLHNLVYLNLSNNKFEGAIPNNLPSGLVGLDLSLNNLSGVIPENLQQFRDSSFHPGNPLLITSGISHVPHNRIKHATKAVILAAMFAGVAIVFAISMVGLCCIISNKGENRSWKGYQEQLYPGSAQTQTVERKGYTPEVSSSFVLEKSYEQTKKDSNEQPSPLSFSSPENPLPFMSRLSFNSPTAGKIHSPSKVGEHLQLFDSSMLFTAEELACAPAELLGKSCHGTMYKATLGPGRVLAVKWLAGGIAKGRKDFVRELKKLGDIRHPNLLSFRGYFLGSKDHEKMILTAYIDAQSLAFHLKEAEAEKLPSLSIDERLRIAVRVAECLNYLHNKRAIPHGNLKLSNILLLPPAMNPVLTDYSLHRLLTSAGTAEQVIDAGVLGYMPPEFSSSSKPCPSLKSDVYAFGVILLEILTGKISGDLEFDNSGMEGITDWVRLRIKENRVDECFDPMLSERTEKNNSKALYETLRIAMRCTLPAPERPDIETVFVELSSIAPNISVNS